MNSTQTLPETQSPIRQIASRLITCLLVLIGFAFIGYALYTLLFREGTYAVVTAQPDGFFSRIASVILSQLPRTVWLLLLYLSAFTLWGPILSFALSAWYGLSVGCTLAMLQSGTLLFLAQSPALPVLFSFASVVLMLLLASLTSVYARALCSASLSEDGASRSILWLEYSSLFLVISGGVYLFGSAAVLCH